MLVRSIKNPDAVARVLQDCSNIPLRIPMVFVQWVDTGVTQLFPLSKLEAV